MNTLEKMYEAARLLREAAEEIEQADFYRLEVEIKLRLQMPSYEYFCMTKPGEKESPS